MNELILNWQRRVDLDEALYYKKSAERQTIFMRDDICRDLLRIPCFVVSHHVSKSCLLPVYFFKLNNCIEVICRENFYGWVVSVKTPTSECEISLPADLIHGDGDDKDIHPVYCEGFKDEWVFPYSNKHKMTFRVRNNYQFWSLMRELNKYNWNIYKNTVEVPRTKENILDILRYIKQANDKLEPRHIFEKTWHLDSRDYYKGCFDLWEDLDLLSERIMANDDLFECFVNEWQTLKYGFEFNKEI
jgi:hypothetical protein